LRGRSASADADARVADKTKKKRYPSPLPFPVADGLPLVVEPDGALIFADGSCRAVVAVDQFLNLTSYGPLDKERICGELAALVNGLALNQDVQIVIESNPVQPDIALTSVRAAISTEHATLREVAGETLDWLEGELARSHVPALTGYLIIAPAPEAPLGIAGAIATAREMAGVRAPQEVDRRGLDAAVDDVLMQSKAMDLVAHRLRRSDVLALLWRTVNPGVPQPEGLAEAEDLADALMPPQWREQYGEIAHAQGGRTVYTRSLYLLGARETTSPGWLGELIALNCTTRFSWHVRGLDRDRERSRLLRKRRAFAGVLAGQIKRGTLTSTDAEANGIEATELAEDLLDATVGLVRSTFILTLQAPTLEDLDGATRRAMSIIRTRLGARAGRGRGYQGPLWKASLPLGQNAARGRAKRWRTETAGNSFPFLTHSPGTVTGLPLGFSSRGHELVLLNLIDPSLPNSVMVVTGRQGSGKTFLLQKLALWTLYGGGRVTVIDRAGHFQPLIEIAGGTYIAPGKEVAPKTVNLWDLPAGETLRKKIDLLVAAHEILLVNPGEKLDPEERSVVEQGIKAVYAQHGNGAELLVGEDAPLERELVSYLERQAARKGITAGERDMLRRLHATLLQYAGDGRYAHLVDRPTTVDINVPVLCFDLDELPDTLYALTLFTIAAAMAHRAKSTYDATRGTSQEMLIVDEGWFIAKYAGAARQLNDWARRSRHLGLLFAFASQQIGDMTDNDAARPIFDAASLKCVFKLHDVRPGDQDTIAWAQGVLHIAEEEARGLTRLRNGQMVLFRESKDGTQRRGEVDVMAPPLERWTFTTETWTDVPARNAAVARYGSMVAAIKHLASAEGR